MSLPRDFHYGLGRMDGSVMHAEAQSGPEGHSDEQTESNGASLKASQLWLGSGLAVATITVLSGIAATIFQFHDESEI